MANYYKSKYNIDLLIQDFLHTVAIHREWDFSKTNTETKIVKTMYRNYKRQKKSIDWLKININIKTKYKKYKTSMCSN